ncbi:MAG: nucleotidyltransferase domain-containing protein [Nannocystaceae bacterium]
MAQEVRIEGLRGVDPRTVPLPHGTQITTTAELRPDDGQRPVPVGSVGTVVEHLPNARLRVRIVGRGEHVLRREQVHPAKAGQVRYAVTRARDEAALLPCVVLEATVGSRAWGLSDEDSDHDLRGVFVLPFGWRQGLVDPPAVLVSADGSRTWWEAERAIRQALRADPNTLEMLFVPEVRLLDPLGQRLLEEREAFVSQAIYGSFGRYALAQAKRLRQSLRLAEHRGRVLDWLRAEPGLSLDAVAQRLADSDGPDDERPDPARARQYLKQLYRSLYDQGLLHDNSFAGLAELAARAHLELELPRELRPKNAYNLLRIVCCAVQWLRTGEPLIETRGELRDRLRAIKDGRVALRQALAWTEAAATELDAAREGSPLPERPDLLRADALLRELRHEAARRAFASEPGPWGHDAPVLPPPEPDHRP